MMTSRRSLLMVLSILLVLVSPLFTSWIPVPSFTPGPSVIYPGNHAFNHQTGIRDPSGWDAYYRQNHPGYLVSGLKNGGALLPEGNYRYDFFFALRSGNFFSLL